MNFTRGDFVRITLGEQTVHGMVMLASGNSKSLMLGFHGVLHSPSGGLFAGSMPVLLDDAGVYRDLVEGHPVQITTGDRRRE